MKLFEEYLKTFDSESPMEGSVSIFRKKTEEKKSVREKEPYYGGLCEKGICFESGV
jgi:hypothetical protein